MLLCLQWSVSILPLAHVISLHPSPQMLRSSPSSPSTKNTLRFYALLLSLCLSHLSLHYSPLPSPFKPSLLRSLWHASAGRISIQHSGGWEQQHVGYPLKRAEKQKAGKRERWREEMVGVEGQRRRRTKDEELGQIERGGELKKTWKHSLRECTLNNTLYILIKIICKHVCGYLLYMCVKKHSLFTF